MATWEHLSDEELADEIRRFEWLLTIIVDPSGLSWVRRRLQELKGEQSRRTGS